MNWLSIVALALAPFQSLGGDPAKDFILVGEKAYGMILPVKVCGAGVSSASWSPDGTYVLLERQELSAGPDQIKRMLLEAASGGVKGPPPMETTLTAWNRKTGKSVDLFRRTGPVQVRSASWVQGTSVALAWISETQVMPSGSPEPVTSVMAVIELDARVGTSRVLATETGPDPGLDLSVSPRAGMAVIVRHKIQTIAGKPQNQMSLQPYRPGLPLPTPIELPPNAFYYGWSDDGFGVRYAQMQPRQSSDSERIAPKHYVVDLRTGQTREIQAAPGNDIQLPRNYAVDDLKIVPVFWPRMGAQRALRPVFLLGKDDRSPLEEGDPPTPADKNAKSAAKPAPGALITAEAEYAELCPTKDGVLYITRGVAMFRPIIEVPKALYLQAKEAAERAEAISRAKQVALGLIMYSADHDDTLPSNAGNWQGDVAPYLKNDSLFSGFNYTFQGGDVTKIDRPAETELGYITVPGGRAVAYCDGHVRYIPDK